MKRHYKLFSITRTVAVLLLTGMVVTGIACSQITDYGEEEITETPSEIQDVSQEDLKGELKFQAPLKLDARGAISLKPVIRPKISTSISLDKKLMYIVDGVVKTSFSLSDLDPSSIESIEVLRGAKATEQYGTQAKDGVVIVRTKDQDREGESAGWSEEFIRSTMRNAWR